MNLVKVEQLIKLIKVIPDEDIETLLSVASILGERFAKRNNISINKRAKIWFKENQNEWGNLDKLAVKSQQEGIYSINTNYKDIAFKFGCWIKDFKQGKL